MVLTADFLLEFRFEYLWPFWLLLRSAYDSFKYQGLVSLEFSRNVPSTILFFSFIGRCSDPKIAMIDAVLKFISIDFHVVFSRLFLFSFSRCLSAPILYV